MNSVLMIGAQGYLGTRLQEYLAEHKFNCTGIDAGFFKDGLLYPPHTENVTEGDARGITAEKLEDYDAVIMLAGISNDPFGNLSYEQIYDPTRHYAIEVAKHCKKLGKKFIFPSSCSVYGDVSGFLDEKSPVNPLTPYSLNKLQIETDLAKLGDDEFSPIALRFGTVYGPSPRVRFDLVINMLCGMALTRGKVILNSDGQAWRPHLYIDDAMKAIKCSLEWQDVPAGLQLMNVGSNENNLKIIDVAQTIVRKVNGCTLQIMGSDADVDDLIRDRKIQDNVDKRTYRVCFDHIHNTLPNFDHCTNIDQGIDLLLQNLQDHNLIESSFTQREFYRLQQLEHLHAEGKLKDDLTWI